MRTSKPVAPIGKEEHFRWVVEFGIDRIHIEDGFELTLPMLQDAISKAVPYAYRNELSVRIVKAPPEAVLRATRR